ncbi:unnamed protein product [marine sediment metagenome]|uniref:YitH acetyltransferase (GNAT) domain-containing protein n=1 Tax=marine sediment metagenome TaxID=412755 RepID=X1CRY5_9ZZZZ
MNNPEIRFLGNDDEQILEAFLRPRLDTSLFLVSNMRMVGLNDRGQRFEGTYVAAFEDGKMAGVIAHYWNGNAIVQAPKYADVLMRAAIERSGRPLEGFLGPGDQVTPAVENLGLAKADYRVNNLE